MSSMVGARYRSRVNHKATCLVRKVEARTTTTVTVHAEDRSRYPQSDTLDEVAFNLLYEPVPGEDEDTDENT